MKMIKYVVLTCLLLLSGKIFSQSFKPADLIGAWTLNTGESSFVIIFKNDSMISQNLLTKKSESLYYTLDLHKSTSYLKTQATVEPGNSGLRIYRIKKMSQDQFSLETTKWKTLPADSKAGNEVADPDKITMILNRKKDS